MNCIFAAQKQVSFYFFFHYFFQVHYWKLILMLILSWYRGFL
jgi:hypothetical protein